MIRTITYTVTADTRGITPNTIQWAGMQYEDCATEVVFDLSAVNIEKALYRIDFNSNGAGYHSSDNLTLNSGKISRCIPKFITQHGGEVQATAVITELNSAGEETGVVYSYPVKVRFTAVEKSELGDETVEGNISMMEASVKDMTRRCEDASSDAARFAKSAENDRTLTEEARFALEHDSEFVFLGGDASGSVSTELVVDGEMSDASQNPVMNKTVKAYVDRAKDFVVEQGTSGIWTYRKWNSGIAECWGSLIHTPTETVANGGDLRIPVDLPFTFAGAPSSYIHPEALAYKIRKAYGIAPTTTSITVYGKFEDNEGLATTEFISFGIQIKGRWK